MVEATDLEISAGVRRELAGRRIDLKQLSFTVAGGSIEISGDLAFIGIEKSIEETAVELKFIESSLKSQRGVKKINWALNNWIRTESGSWEPKSGIGDKKSDIGAKLSGDGLHCPECDYTIRFCPCCGKPLVKSDQITKQKTVTTLPAKPLLRKPEPIRKIVQPKLSPAVPSPAIAAHSHEKEIKTPVLVSDSPDSQVSTDKRTEAPKVSPSASDSLAKLQKSVDSVVKPIEKQKQSLKPDIPAKPVFEPVLRADSPRPAPKVIPAVKPSPGKPVELPAKTIPTSVIKVASKIGSQSAPYDNAQKPGMIAGDSLKQQPKGFSKTPAQHSDEIVAKNLPAQEKTILPKQIDKPVSEANRGAVDPLETLNDLIPEALKEEPHSVEAKTSTEEKPKESGIPTQSLKKESIPETEESSAADLLADNGTPLPIMKPKVEEPAAPPAGKKKLEGFPLDDETLLPPMKPKVEEPAVPPAGKKKLEGFPPDDETLLPPMKPKVPPQKSAPQSKTGSPDPFSSLFQESNGKDPDEAATKSSRTDNQPSDMEDLSDLNLDLSMLDLLPQKKKAGSSGSDAPSQKPVKPDDPFDLSGVIDLDDPAMSLLQGPQKKMKSDDKSAPKPSDKDKEKDKGSKDPFSLEDFDISKFKL